MMGSIKVAAGSPLPSCNRHFAFLMSPLEGLNCASVLDLGVLLKAKTASIADIRKQSRNKLLLNSVHFGLLLMPNFQDVYELLQSKKPLWKAAMMSRRPRQMPLVAPDKINY